MGRLPLSAVSASGGVGGRGRASPPSVGPGATPPFVDEASVSAGRFAARLVSFGELDADLLAEEFCFLEGGECLVCFLVVDELDEAEASGDFTLAG